MIKYRYLSFFIFTILFLPQLAAENGSQLWLRYGSGNKIPIVLPYHSPTLDIAAQELRQAWRGKPITLILQKDKQLKSDGFCIQQDDNNISICSPSEIGLLYGAYYLLRIQASNVQPQVTVSHSPILENPTYDLRILNHWDNLDRTVERGYAGQSLWNWEELPAQLSDSYTAYARANASIGINGTVLNNVNASPSILTTGYLNKVKALADVFRPYGLKVYLAVNFASPMVLDNLPTADPLNKDVIRWWKNKIHDIYQIIPDFGGFLVKANSEGQPGPCDFGRTHAQGANMLANVLKPFHGIVMWRAFVYNSSDADRAKQAYEEFHPLDGQFSKNVFIQIKNGPIDFQPREPYSPLFGTMPKTQLMAEFQITQEYLGQANHLVYLAPMWKEFFGLVDPHSLKAIAGVSNIGTDANWCGSDFAQANWYAFGRLAWNPALSSEQLAEEWLKQTFSNETNFIVPVKKMMLASREAAVDYMMPLGLHHLFAWGHHYGPEPWCKVPDARPDWLPSYYHQADQVGIGFNRSSTGSNAVAQYPERLQQQYNSIDNCPEEYLLWFHHVPWNHKMKSGRSLWEELCYKYDHGVQQVRLFQKTWDSVKPYVDVDRFNKVQSRLKTQIRDAIWWKDACLLYFQEFSGSPIPLEIERPIHELKEMKAFKLNISNYECAPYGYNK